MTPLGTMTHPLRIAIIGAGPSGFYVAEHLLHHPDLAVDIDLLERLPTPYGLVRYGVAPDHHQIKAVTATYDQIAAHPRVRFYGGVEFGRHLTLDDLRDFYHQIVFATGTPTDQRLGIPGEDGPGSYPATAFVGWYNGHPDFRDLQFDFSHRRAAVIGMGNVALDVARILCRAPEELATTDMPDYAIAALRQSQIEEVYVLGRRGPAQAACTPAVLKELGTLTDVEIRVAPHEVALDASCDATLAQSIDRATARKIALFQGYAQRHAAKKPRAIVFRFLVSPVAFLNDATGHIAAIRLVKNTLVMVDGTLQAHPTAQYEELPVGLAFRAVGHRGAPLPGVPCDPRRGGILHHQGRVLDPRTKQPLTGLYTAGWSKRGPTGVIGTNKPDAMETVRGMLEDASQGTVLQPPHPDPAAATARIRARQPAAVSYTDWQQLNALEVARGVVAGRPRVKFTHVDEMRTALACIQGS